MSEITPEDILDIVAQYSPSFSERTNQVLWGAASRIRDLEGTVHRLNEIIEGSIDAKEAIAYSGKMEGKVARLEAEVARLNQTIENMSGLIPSAFPPEGRTTTGIPEIAQPNVGECQWCGRKP